MRMLLKVGCRWASLSRYEAVYTHVAKRPSDQGVRFEAVFAAAAKKAEDEVSHFMRSLFFI